MGRDAAFRGQEGKVAAGKAGTGGHGPDRDSRQTRPSASAFAVRAASTPDTDQREFFTQACVSQADGRRGGRRARSRGSGRAEGRERRSVCVKGGGEAKAARARVPFWGRRGGGAFSTIFERNVRACMRARACALHPPRKCALVARTGEALEACGEKPKRSSWQGSGKKWKRWVER